LPGNGPAVAERDRQGSPRHARGNGSHSGEAGARSWSNDVAAGKVPGTVLEGNMGDYLDAAQDARGNWAAAKRSDTLAGMAARAAGNAEVGNGDLASRLRNGRTPSSTTPGCRSG
jgi:hypothetical protein